MEAAAAQDAELADDAPFTLESGGLLTESGVAVRGNEITLGDGYPGVSVPADADPVAEVTADGTVVFTDTLPGLDVVIEAAEDGRARMLTVADESFSGNPEHRYSYELDLPDDGILDRADDGTVYVLVPVTAADMDAAASLGDVQARAGGDPRKTTP